MAFLVDTNVLSEIRKKDRCNPQVTAWIGSVDPDELFISVLSLGEIRRGIELIRKRDAPSARVLHTWLKGLATHYEERILPITPNIADRWGQLSPDQPLPVTDGLLAATALEHRLALVTRNVVDFRRSGVELLDPFAPSTS